MSELEKNVGGEQRVVEFRGDVCKWEKQQYCLYIILVKNDWKYGRRYMQMIICYT